MDSACAGMAFVSALALASLSDLPAPACCLAACLSCAWVAEMLSILKCAAISRVPQHKYACIAAASFASPFLPLFWLWAGGALPRWWTLGRGAAAFAAWFAAHLAWRRRAERRWLLSVRESARARGGALRIAGG